MRKETRESAVNHAIACFPQESCGVILIKNGKEVYWPCRNVAASKFDHFILSPEDWAEAEDLGEIIGIVHSHPNESSRPSEADKVGCENSGLPWYILSIGQEPNQPPTFHSEHAIAPSGYKAPLVGREFHHGVLDCYALIKDFYKQEMNIDLMEFTRTDEWWNRGENLYMKNIELAGFVPIDGELEYGDVIIMQVRAPEPNHAGVYLGDNTFLHHLYGRLSSKDMYGGYWREVTRIVVRHKSLIK